MNIMKYRLLKYLVDSVYFSFSDGLNKCVDSIMAKKTSSTFIFPETAFTTVTAYQNQQVRISYIFLSSKSIQHVLRYWGCNNNQTSKISVGNEEDIFR